MTVGLLLITHGNIGRELLDTAISTLGYRPIESKTYGITETTNPELALMQCKQLLAELNHPDGVIIFTDAYGSTPSNIASQLARQNNVSLIAGVNLPMLLRLMNYPGQPREKLVELALAGGKDGILLAEGLIHPL